MATGGGMNMNRIKALLAGTKTKWDAVFLLQSNRQTSIGKQHYILTYHNLAS